MLPTAKEATWNGKNKKETEAKENVRFFDVSGCGGVSSSSSLGKYDIPTNEDDDDTR